MNSASTGGLLRGPISMGHLLSDNIQFYFLIEVGHRPATCGSCCNESLEFTPVDMDGTSLAIKLGCATREFAANETFRGSDGMRLAWLFGP